MDDDTAAANYVGETTTTGTTYIGTDDAGNPVSYPNEPDPPAPPLGEFEIIIGKVTLRVPMTGDPGGDELALRQAMWSYLTAAELPATAEHVGGYLERALAAPPARAGEVVPVAPAAPPHPGYAPQVAGVQLPQMQTGYAQQQVPQQQQTVAPASNKPVVAGERCDRCHGVAVFNPAFNSRAGQRISASVECGNGCKDESTGGRSFNHRVRWVRDGEQVALAG